MLVNPCDLSRTSCNVITKILLAGKGRHSSRYFLVSVSRASRVANFILMRASRVANFILMKVAKKKVNSSMFSFPRKDIFHFQGEDVYPINGIKLQRKTKDHWHANWFCRWVSIINRILIAINTIIYLNIAFVSLLSTM